MLKRRQEKHVTKKQAKPWILISQASAKAFGRYVWYGGGEGKIIALRIVVRTTTTQEAKVTDKSFAEMQ